MTEEEDDNESSSSIGAIIGIVLILLVGWWVYNSWIKSEWVPLRIGSDNAAQAGPKFSGSDDCLAYAYTNGYTECGKNCSPPPSPLGSYKCKDTAD